MVISSKSILIGVVPLQENAFLRLSKAMVTEARDGAETPFDPLKIRSVPALPRSDFMDCSPKTKRIASTMFDLPEPFGPTTAVIGVVNSSESFLPNDLKPEISNLFNMYVLF